MTKLDFPVCNGCGLPISITKHMLIIKGSFDITYIELKLVTVKNDRLVFHGTNCLQNFLSDLFYKADK